MKQKDKIFQALKGKPQTMLEVSKRTGIERANICRRIADLQKQNKAFLIGYRLCTISKHKAGIYTTDKSKVND